MTVLTCLARPGRSWAIAVGWVVLGWIALTSTPRPVLAQADAELYSDSDLYAPSGESTPAEWVDVLPPDAPAASTDVAMERRHWVTMTTFLFSWGALCVVQMVIAALRNRVRSSADFTIPQAFILWPMSLWRRYLEGCFACCRPATGWLMGTKPIISTLVASACLAAVVLGAQTWITMAVRWWIELTPPGAFAPIIAVGISVMLFAGLHVLTPKVLAAERGPMALAAFIAILLLPALICLWIFGTGALAGLFARGMQATDAATYVGPITLLGLCMVLALLSSMRLDNTRLAQKLGSVPAPPRAIEPEWTKPDYEFIRDKINLYLTSFADERNCFQPKKHEQHVLRLANALEGLGYAVNTRRFQYAGHDWPNLEIEAPMLGDSLTSEALIVFAAADTPPGSPGGNAGGSGLVALLALAASAIRGTHSRRLRFVITAIANARVDSPELLGPQAYVDHCIRRGERIRGVIALGSLGTFADAPGSQLAPPLRRGLWYPEVANFVAVHASDFDQGWPGEFLRTFCHASQLPVRPVACGYDHGLPSEVLRQPWQMRGVPVVLVSDSGAWRDAALASRDDTAERIDIDRLASAVTSIDWVLATLASRKIEAATAGDGGGNKLEDVTMMGAGLSQTLDFYAAPATLGHDDKPKPLSGVHGGGHGGGHDASLDVTLPSLATLRREHSADHAALNDLLAKTRAELEQYKERLRELRARQKQADTNATAASNREAELEDELDKMRVKLKLATRDTQDDRLAKLEEIERNRTELREQLDRERNGRNKALLQLITCFDHTDRELTLAQATDAPYAEALQHLRQNVLLALQSAGLEMIPDEPDYYTSSLTWIRVHGNRGVTANADGGYRIAKWLQRGFRRPGSKRVIRPATVILGDPGSAETAAPTGEALR